MTKLQQMLKSHAVSLCLPISVYLSFSICFSISFGLCLSLSLCFSLSFPLSFLLKCDFMLHADYLIGARFKVLFRKKVWKENECPLQKVLDSKKVWMHLCPFTTEDLDACLRQFILYFLSIWLYHIQSSILSVITN